MRATIASILACVLLAGCGDNTSVRFCTGGAAFCSSVGNTNRAPNADAGADQEVVAAELVRLDGTRSSDPEGRIESYAWVQTAGTPVALTNPDRALATFLAPDVEETEVLEFTLTVTDDHNRSDSDATVVTVVPRPVAAVAAGFELLEKFVYPRSLDGPARCAEPAARAGDRETFLGLWLIARTLDVADRANDRIAVSSLLDELRRLFPQSVEFHLNALSLAVLRAGLEQASAFTRLRDPALSAALRAQLDGLGAADPAIAAALRSGDFRLRRTDTGMLAFDEGDAELAIRTLLQARCMAGIDAPLIAAATVSLACRAGQASDAARDRLVCAPGWGTR